MTHLAQYPLTHRALVCSRMDMFPQMTNVNALSTHGAVLPRGEIPLDRVSDSQAKDLLLQLFPLFLHNLIRAEGFPLQDKLAPALNQMEQSIRENADNPVVKELLTCGLKGEVFNAGGLPEKADAKRAVSLYLARSEWDTLYRTFTLKVVKTLVAERGQIARWVEQQQAQANAGSGLQRPQATA